MNKQPDPIDWAARKKRALAFHTTNPVPVASPGRNGKMVPNKTPGILRGYPYQTEPKREQGE